MTETRLKKQRRGWYLDTDPGFHGVKSKFEDAEKKNGERAIKMAAWLDVLRKYALLDGEGNPIENLTQFLHGDDFGYGKRKATQGRAEEEQTLFGPNANSAAGAATGMSIGNGLNGARNGAV